MKVLKLLFRFVLYFSVLLNLALQFSCLNVYSARLVLSCWLLVMLWLFNCQSSKYLNQNVKFNHIKGLFRDEVCFKAHIGGFKTHIVHQFIQYEEFLWRRMWLFKLEPFQECLTCTDHFIFRSALWWPMTSKPSSWAHQSFMHFVCFSDGLCWWLCWVKHLVRGDALWSLMASVRGHIRGRRW